MNFKNNAVKMLLICTLVTMGWFGSAMAKTSQASAATQQSMDLLYFSKQFIGTPYIYGSASGNTSSFDCSSYTQYIFGKFGISLPRTAAAQSTEGVFAKYLSVGDLVFFKTRGKISHVAIYAGDGKILHASSSKGVTLSSMKSGYWKNTYVTARRVL